MLTPALGVLVMLPDRAQLDDVAIVERPRDKRILVSIPGRYVLADHRNPRGDRRQFSCRAVYVSAGEMVLAAPVSGALGERVIAHIDRLGRIEGAVIRILSRGFVMSIVASPEDRLKLLDKIEWIEKHKNHDVCDQRTHGRFMPANPYSRLMLADGTTMTCLVIDLSETGAAISADYDPEIGAACALGTIVGRVVRRFAGGFALQFFMPLSRASVEGMAIVNE